MEKGLSLDQLKKYLENVIELEGQILTGQQVIERIDKEKKNAVYRLNHSAPSVVKPLEKPQKREFEDFYGEEIDGTAYVERPKSNSMDLKSTLLISAISFIVIGGIGCGISMFVSSLFNLNFATVCTWAVIISALLAIAIAAVLIVDNNQSSKKLDKWCEENREYEKKYEKEKAKRLKAIDEEFKQEMNKYSRHVKEAEESLAKDTETNNQSIKAIESATSAETKRVEDAILSTKVALKKIYDKDIIYPKYRNFISVCSLYEYLASGRCNCLEGHEGAYNLYEAELRQDLILIKLDIVISQLEDIKKNQYTLYQKMCEINSAVKSISYQMGELLKKTDALIDTTNKIADNTASIAQNTRITALCSQMTAKNTEAIKYLSLIN